MNAEFIYPTSGGLRSNEILLHFDFTNEEATSSTIGPFSLEMEYKKPKNLAEVTKLIAPLIISGGILLKDKVYMSVPWNEPKGKGFFYNEEWMLDGLIMTIDTLFKLHLKAILTREGFPIQSKERLINIVFCDVVPGNSYCLQVTAQKGSITAELIDEGLGYPLRHNTEPFPLRPHLQKTGQLHLPTSPPAKPPNAIK
jgi:hypothetical protein